METGRRRKRGGAGRTILIALLVLVLLAAAGLFAATRFFLIKGGHFYSRSAAEIDLRGQKITVEEYEELRRELPDTAILWDVPLSGGAFDQNAEKITLSAFDRSDLDLLDYFTSLRYVDAVGADMTAEDYERLCAALPEGEVRWSVPLSGGRFPCDAEEIAPTALTKADTDLFGYFTSLQRVDARACTDYEAVFALREAYPDLEVLWQVAFSGKTYPQDTQELYVDDPSVTAEELRAALECLPAVKTVDAPVNNWSEAEKKQLKSDLPDVAFLWPVTIAGTVYTGQETQIDLSGRTLTAAEIEELKENGPYLAEVKTVDLTGTGVTLEDVLVMKESMPETDFIFDFELFGVPINSMDTFIDFTGKTMESTDQVESILPLMPNLEKVDMSDCGIKDEKMDALNKSYENVRFVWTLHISVYDIRTDAVSFIGSTKYYGNFTTKTIEKLSYCEDMICLDMGHRTTDYMGHKELDFLYGMPNLKYLILADSQSKDLTPIGSLKNLVFLEIILSYSQDLTPLTGCTALEDLNVCFNYDTNPDSNFAAFSQMTWLKRLYFSNTMVKQTDQEKLRELLPNTDIHVIYNTAQATGDHWRYSKNYYDMRDMLGYLWYMDDYGGRQWSKWIDGVEYPLDKDFLAQQVIPDNGKH